MTTYCSPTTASALRLDTIQRHVKGLTKTQAEFLRRAASDRSGTVKSGTDKGFGSASRRRMFNALCVARLMTSADRGGYEITPFGRQVIAEHDASRAAR